MVDIQGTHQNDNLTGTDDDDVIFGLGGADTIFGNDGDDIIYGEGVLPKESAKEYMSLLDTTHRVHTKATDISQFTKDDVVDNLILAASRDDYFNDVIIGGAGDDTVYGGLGNDILYGDIVDYPYGSIAPAGNDRLDAGAGDDTVYGGLGDDVIRGGTGDDVLYGDVDGRDAPFGNAILGDDLIIAGDGDDEVYGAGGDDTLAGNDGDDYLYGYIGDDFINGGAGDDILLGDEGSDTLLGGDGDDWIRGDTLQTGGMIHIGNDVIDGGAGDDRIYSISRGENLVTGGAGKDKFEFTKHNANSGSNTTITDFTIGEDDIQLVGYSITPTPGSLYPGVNALSLEQVGADTVLTLETNMGSHTVTLLGIDMHALNDSDFIF